jgi:hypothetical protein
MACLWYLFCTLETDELTFLTKYDLLSYDPFEQYLTFFYFILVTLITVGYGDMTA